MTNQHSNTLKEKMVEILFELGLISEGDRINFIINFNMHKIQEEIGYILLHGSEEGMNDVREDRAKEN